MAYGKYFLYANYYIFKPTLIIFKKIFKYHKSIINILNFDNLAYTQESKIKFGSLNLVIDEHMFKAINEEQIMDIVLPLN